MFKRNIKGISLLLVLALFIGLTAVIPSFAAENTIITLFHTNDVHGRVDASVSGSRDNPIGIAKIAAIKADTENSLLIDAGDATHGTPIAVLDKGENIIALMNAAGYDYMAIGNHEFNYGYDRLIELSEMADFPMMASNIVNSEGGRDFDIVEISEIAGIKVGVFGLSTEHTGDTANPANIKGLTFENCITTATEKVAQLTEMGADVIVAVCHMGEVSDGSGTTSTELAEKVAGIDVIIDGHSHSTYEEGLTVGDTLIASAFQYESYLGRVTLEIAEDKTVVSKTARLMTAEEIDAIELSEAALAVKAEVTDKLNVISEQFSELLNQEIGYSNVSLSSARAPGVRTQQTDIGYLVAEAYRTAVGADICIANGGDIRSDLVKGAITYGDLITILPFFNTLQVKAVTPKILKAVLENGVSYLTVGKDGKVDPSKSASGRFPQVAGFSFTYDPSLPVGERILSITLDGGKELDFDDDKTLITLGASSFVLSGGDDYEMLTDLEILHESGFTADQALIDYMNGNKITADYFKKNNSDRSVMVSASEIEIIAAPIALSLGYDILVP